MDYERIHKAQTGIISPSKLRMKLMGPNHQKKKEGSNSNSSRTSPSRLEDSEFVNNSLLASQIGDFGEEVSNLEVSQIKSDVVASDGHFRMQLVSKGDSSNSNSSSIHPVRMCEDENLDYDSTSSFEFHKGERPLHQSVARSFNRPMSSKWNDAEKWIMNKQNVQLTKANVQNQMKRQPALNMVRVVPESMSSENKPSVKRVDFCQVEGGNALIDLCPESKDLREVNLTSLPCTKSLTEETAAVPAIRSVSMRDMGTDMTPIPSQEPSRSATPATATSPTSSIPSTPRRGEPSPTTTQHTARNSSENAKIELSEHEQKLKTRREIEALGVQLGKMNIAAWAGKDEREKSDSGKGSVGESESLEMEFAKRADAWEEAEKAKHAARFKREEIRIQAWESQQKARLEAEMRKIEAQIEQMKAQAQAKMVKKVAMARQKSEEKRTAAEASKNRQAEKTAARVEYIRKTGRIPSSSCLFNCCGWP